MKSPNFTNFIYWAFCGLISFIGVMTYMEIRELNQNMSRVVLKQVTISNDVLGNTSRIAKLEADR